MQDLISIIIPVYNTAEYLKDCLRSVCGQTHRNLEIICVDDGSTDGSGSIVDEFAAQDDRIMVMHRENGGEGAARNTGLGIAHGAYIGFVDSDDWIESDMYESLLAALHEFGADMAACRYFKDMAGACVDVQNDKPVQPSPWNRDMLLRYVYHRDAYRGVTGYIVCKLYRREILQDREGKWTRFDESLALGTDILYFAEAAIRAKRTAYIDKAYYHYLQRETSSFHSQDERKWKQMIVTYRRLLSRLEKADVPEDVLLFVKRFLVYRGEVVAKLAYKNRNPEVLAYSQDIMRRYGEEYLQTNAEYPERIREYHEILAYQPIEEKGQESK